jgi:hypothetical protein
MSFCALYRVEGVDHYKIPLLRMVVGVKIVFAIIANDDDNQNSFILCHISFRLLNYYATSEIASSYISARAG